MTTQLKTIDQSGLRALLDARFEHPGLYAGKPLFIWQAAWLDGIQLALVMDVMRQDIDKPKEERKYFRVNTLRADKDYREAFTTHRQGVTAGYVVYPGETLPLDRCLGEVEKLISANDSPSPLIVYLPYRYQSLELPGEQYIFEPDFEQWAATWPDPLIPDFIRGNGDKKGILYRWYNLFNDPDKGCTTPSMWDAVCSRLHMSVRFKLKVPFNKVLDYTLANIAEFGDDFIRSGFQLEASKGHISDDVVDDFVKYLKNLQ